MQKHILVLVLSALSISPFLQASPLEVKSVQKDAIGMTLQMEVGVLQLQLSGDRTIHVLYSSTGDLPKVPSGFAVQKQPLPRAFTINDATDAVTLKTAQCSVEVNKKTGALSFLGNDQKPFLVEAVDGGKVFTPSMVAGVHTNTVEQKFALDPSEGLYGLGQHPNGVMNYVGSSVHLQQVNGDIAVPVLVSSKGYGLFWNNPSVTDVSFSQSSDPNAIVDWRSTFGSAIDYYVFYGPALDQVIADYRELTGAVPMFGRWGWGFWQCKERYVSQQELLDVAGKYRQMKIPIDGVIQDWRYWDPHLWGSHQFDESRYPDPAQMMKDFHAESIHLLISVWPKFMGDSPNSIALEAAGDLYPKMTVPGSQDTVEWYDPFKPGARQLYWHQISQELFSKGIDGWWLDASEPELNANWGEYLKYQTASGSAAEVCNAYPLLHTTSVYEGQRAENKDKRVFILTRSAYAGQQRNAAVSWSGDITGNWETYKKQIAAGINFTMSGIPYWNTDTGGFHGGDPASPDYAELFTRWFQFSAFCPMFRVHGTNYPKEMWRFDPATQKILINYDKFRYHLLPYIYSVAWKVTSAGSTMMRGLVMDFPHDPRVHNIPDQYMFGPALMVNPVTNPTGTMDVPSSAWLDKTGQPGALSGNYYQGENFEQKILERRDPSISFNWDADAPDPRMRRSSFSVRWEGFISIDRAGEYTFQMTADDGMRLWVDGKLVIEDWAARSSVTKTAKVMLPVNARVPVKIEYFQDQAGASVDLKWTPPTDKTVISTRSVYLPDGVSWVNFWTGQATLGGQSVDTLAPIETMPLYVRAGSIIPYGPEVQSAMEKEDPIEVRIYRGANGSFTLYEDENDNYNYEQGVYATIPFIWDEAKQTLTIGARQGQFPGMMQTRTFRIVLVSANHGVGIENTAQPDKEIIYDGSAITISVK